MQNRRSAASRPTLARLSVEALEERRLMDAAGLLNPVGITPTAQERLLVAYQGASDPVVQAVGVGSLQQALAGYASDAAVRYAEPDFRVSVAALPSDTYFGNTWGLNNTAQSGGTLDADIDAAEAWDVVRGSYRSVVAVIDSGIDYTHADLYQNIWINQGEIPASVRSLLADVDGDSLITFADLNDARNIGAGKITDLSGNGVIDGRDLLFSVAAGGWADGASNDGDRYVDDLVGWNFAANTNDPFDDNGHGTHVAGTIAARGDNGRGVAGVLWQAQLVGLKFLDAAGSGYTSSAIAALNYAVAKGIKLSNNSWGGGGYSQGLYDAIAAARGAGHVFVAAAGNGGSDGRGDNNDASASYPASYDLDNIISVAATDRRDALAGFSNYGVTSVDVAAPGVDILSTVPNNGYAYFSGTSMATPHVAGVVAMVQAVSPALSYGQTIAQVLGGVDRVAGLAGKVTSGGRVNALAAVSAAAPTPADPTSSPTPVVAPATFTVSARPYAAIRDGYTTVSTINVGRDISISDVDVRLDISHTYDGDLRVYLIAPDGTWAALVRNRGGSGDNFRGTVFDDEASTAVAQARAPFSGSYRPETSLGVFDGKNARGAWRLQVEDWGRGDWGRLNSWSLAVVGAASASARSSADLAAADPAAVPAVIAAARADAALASGALDALGAGGLGAGLSRPDLTRAFNANAVEAARARLVELQRRAPARVDPLASRAAELAGRADEHADRPNAPVIVGRVQSLLAALRR